jgi:benzil reductase ((S)-benzoin forming)
MRLALITGGSKGLGAALCEAYAARGFEVVEFSRSAPHGYSVKVDFSQPEATRATVADTLAFLATKPWDEVVVIQNAGVLDPIGPVSRKAHESVLGNIHTNITSALLFFGECLGAFQALPCRKTLVNISSGAALKGYAGWSLYCAAKAATENFIRSVALEQAEEAHPFLAINVNPGVMDTGMQAAIRSSSASDFPLVRRFVERKEAGELRVPAAVALQVVGFVEAASLLTAGQTFVVA